MASNLEPAENGLADRLSGDVVIDINGETAAYSPSPPGSRHGGGEPVPLQVDALVIDETAGDQPEGENGQNVDDLFALPSYEESQNEHAHINGELPPPYEEGLTVTGLEGGGDRATTPQPRRRRERPTFRDFPVQARCKKCNREVTTTLHHVPGTLTFIIMIVVFFLGGFFLCCLIPLCIPILKDIQHRCPNCRCVIGRYDRLG